MSEQSTYQYAGNNPVYFNDPMGASRYSDARSGTDRWALMDAIRENARGYAAMYNEWSDNSSRVGSGRHWADGIHNGDWSLSGGSQSYRDGLAAGMEDIGGKLYNINADGSRSELEQRNGQYGSYQIQVHMEGNVVATKEVFVPFGSDQQGNANVILNFSEKYYTLRPGSGWLLKPVSSMEKATEYLASLKSKGKRVTNVVLVGHGNYEHITLGENGVIVSDLSGNIKTQESLDLFNQMLAEVAPGGNVLIVGCLAGGPFSNALQNSVRCDINIFMNSHSSTLSKYASDNAVYFGTNIGRQDWGVRNITQDPNGLSPYRNISLNRNGAFNLIR